MNTDTLIPEGLTLRDPGSDDGGMYRNAFGDGYARTVDQLLEVAFEKGGPDLKHADAMIDFDPGTDGEVFDGYSATITAYTDDEVIEMNTVGFKSKAKLIAMLVEAGVPEHKIEDYG